MKFCNSGIQFAESTFPNQLTYLHRKVYFFYIVYVSDGEMIELIPLQMESKANRLSVKQRARN